jgi:hypothetical protein
MILTALFQQDPYLISRTIAEARSLLARLEAIEKRLGTTLEEPGDLELAQETAHRIRSRQVLLMVIRDHVSPVDPEIDRLCRALPRRYDTPDDSAA